MRNRIALFVSAALAGAVLATMLAGDALAADECLARPKGLAPAGQHWYFNTDRKIGRKCWYLDGAGGKTVAVAPKKQPAAAPVEPNRQADVPQPNADARAEFVDEPRNEPLATPLSRAPSVVPKLPSLQEAPDSEKKRDWSVASRWPEASDAFASSPAPAIANPALAPAGEKVSLAVAAAPVLQPTTAVDGNDDVDFGMIAAGLILLVVAGGTVMILSRRNSSARDHRPRRTVDRGEMHWSNRTGAKSVPASRQPEASSRSDVIEEVEQLLAARRQGHGRQALS